MRHEINTSAVRVGQIAQVKMCFRLLKQANGTFTFRQLLKGVYILHDGMSMVRFFIVPMRMMFSNDCYRRSPEVLLMVPSRHDGKEIAT